MKNKAFLYICSMVVLLASCSNNDQTLSTTSEDTTSFETVFTSESEEETSSNLSNETITIGEHDPNKEELISFGEAKLIIESKLNKEETSNYIETISETTNVSALYGAYKYKFNQELDRRPDSLYFYSNIQETISFVSSNTTDIMFKNETNGYTYISNRENNDLVGEKTEEEAKLVINNSYNLLFEGLFVGSFITNNPFSSSFTYYVTNNSSIIIETDKEIEIESFKLSSARFLFNEKGLINEIDGEGNYTLNDKDNSYDFKIDLNSCFKYNNVLEKKTSL